MMKVCFLLVVATVAVLQASGEEKTPTTQGVSNENVTIELLLRRIDQLEQQVLKAEAASHVKQDSSMARKDDLEERLLKKIEKLGDKLQGEIEGVQGDITNVQSDIVAMQAELQAEIISVQSGLIGVQGGLVSVRGDINDMQDKLQGEIEGVQDDLVNVQGDLVGVQDDITNVKGDLVGVQGDITNIQGDFVDMQDKLQEEIKGVQGDITNVQGDIVDMQNANSAFCAYQDEVGNGNYGLSGEIVVYNTTYLETNGASCSLDESTGKFTAGKSGVYQISVSAKNGFTYNDYSFEVYLRTSSGNYQKRKAEIAYQRSSTYYLYTPVNAIRFISLQKGETAWLEYTCSLYRSNFSTAEASMESDSDCYIEDLKFCVSLYK